MHKLTKFSCKRGSSQEDIHPQSVALMICKQTDDSETNT